MLCFDFIEKILGTQGVKLRKAEQNGETIRLRVEMPRKEHRCPGCGKKTDLIHDYREQKIKGGEANRYRIEILYRKRRYVCGGCGKRFYEENSFVGRYKRMTKMMILTILKMVEGTVSFTEIARQMNVSAQTVTRLFDRKSSPEAKALPAVLGIDEFRGNANGEKFQVSLTDPENHTVLDILPKRSESFLIRYFLAIPKEERDKVQYFVSDMYKPYLRVAQICFPKAVHIVDKYHWVRQLFWAFENVRKREQKRFGRAHRLYFKRSRKLLMKQLKKLSEDDAQQVLNLLFLSSDLSTAHFYKECLQKILNGNDPPAAKKKAFMQLVDSMKQSGVHELEQCADTYYNWLPGILASFDCPYTNGFTEGFNNKIKVLKRNAYGYRCFDRFRKRILLMA